MATAARGDYVGVRRVLFSFNDIINIPARPRKKNQDWMRTSMPTGADADYRRE